LGAEPVIVCGEARWTCAAEDSGGWQLVLLLLAPEQFVEFAPFCLSDSGPHVALQPFASVRWACAFGDDAQTSPIEQRLYGR
jgi:hypothetical protein